MYIYIYDISASENKNVRGEEHPRGEQILAALTGSSSHSAWGTYQGEKTLLHPRVLWTNQDKASGIAHVRNSS